MSEQIFKIETEQENDGRWLAEVLGLPGVMAYGISKDDAIAAVQVIAFRVIADQIEQTKIATSQVSFKAA